tara:strand:- start:427 stop:996 length:570 start_codon:yes stop_codon:yes gene_type:complete
MSPLGAARAVITSSADFGKLELIETKTISGTVAQVDFTSIKESTYNVHLLMLSNMLTETDAKRVALRFFESGSIEIASVYQFANFVLEAGGSQANVASTGSNTLRITDNTGNDTGESSNTYVYLYNLGDSSKYSFITCQSSAITSSAVGVTEFGSGVLPQTSTVDGIRVLGDGAINLTGGTMSLYGIKE